MTPDDEHFERRKKRNNGFRVPPSPSHRTWLALGVVGVVVSVAILITFLFVLH